MKERFVFAKRILKAFSLYFGRLLPGDLLLSGLLAWRFITYYLVLAVGAVVALSMGATRQEKEAAALEEGKLPEETDAP